MASEITMSGILQIQKGYLSETSSVQNFKITQTGDGAVSGVQNVGFAASEAIDVGDVSTLGCCFFRNLDTTNFVLIGQNISAGGFDSFIKLFPGEFFCGRLKLATGGVLEAQAATAAVELFYRIYEA